MTPLQCALEGEGGGERERTTLIINDPTSLSKHIHKKNKILSTNTGSLASHIPTLQSKAHSTQHMHNCQQYKQNCSHNGISYDQLGRIATMAESLPSNLPQQDAEWYSYPGGIYNTQIDQTAAIGLHNNVRPLSE